MRGDSASEQPTTTSESDGAIPELVQEHAERLYQFAALFLGDAKSAEAAFSDGYRRIAEELGRSNVFGDAREILYRAVTRSCLTRLAKDRALRGYQANSADDQDVAAAFSVVGGFSMQQRAAVLLAACTESDYRLAGVASGVGESRARDLLYAAEQQFSEAVGGAPAGGSFSDAIRRPTLPAPTEHPRDLAMAAVAKAPARDGGIRRFLRLAAGPGLLTIILIGAMVLIPQCGEPSIKTGAGRTSDIAFGYDRSDQGIVVFDTGSGKTLLRMPNGVVSRDGRRLYHTTVSCDTGLCLSRIQMMDVATQSDSDILTLDGRLAALDVDEVTQLVYLGDEGTEWNRLLAVDLGTKRLVGSFQGPPVLDRPFRPRWVALTEDGQALAAVSWIADAPQGVVLWIETGNLQIINPVRLSIGSADGVVMLPRIVHNRAIVYAAGRPGEDARMVAAPLDTNELARGLRTAPVDGGAQNAMALGPDDLLYVVGDAGAIIRVNPSTMERVGGGIKDAPAGLVTTAIGVSTDGAMLYTIRSDGSYVVIDAESGNELLRRQSVDVASILQVNRGE
ncbi:MAG: hypothetical protein HW416_1118 [Chloroflexi bacterium]|nr:hypothetical protein [Chloroflexota bacterium]